MPNARHPSNPTDDDMRTLLTAARTIAVVGLSDRPERDSHRVAAYLQAHGYTIFPVNPNVTEVLGRRAYASLLDVPAPVDIVNIFRRPEAVPAIVDEAIAIGARAVWMQLGIAHSAAAERARAAGMTVVSDRCIMVEHRRLL